MKNELIVVKQLPVIEDQLLAVKEKIEQRVGEALSLVCTEETYKQIKQVRSDLNKEYADLEKRRKEIKAEILAPYDKFEGVYKDCAGDIYARADRELGAKIREVEDGLKQQKAEDLAAYFTEYMQSLPHIPDGFVKLENAGIKVGLSDSKASLRKQAAFFLDNISADLQVIDGLEYRDEVLAEYSGRYNLSEAMLTVDNRHKAIEAERKRREEAQARAEAAEKAKAAVIAADIAAAVNDAPVAPPVKEEIADAPAAAPEKTLTVAFKVTATLTKLKALKAFLIEGGYDYE